MALGYIGGYLVDKLLSEKCEVCVYDNLFYEERYLKSVKFVNGDVRNTKLLIETCQDYDVIIFLAAIVGDPACAAKPILAQEVNSYAVRDFCDNVPKNKHVVFMSSCSVYGFNDEFVNEESALNPISLYAKTKIFAEKCVQDIGGTIFRLGTIFGKGDNFSRPRNDLVLNILTRNACVNGKVELPESEQWRPIVSVKDISGFVMEACEVQQKGIFNVSYKNIVIRDLSKDLLEIFPNVEIIYKKEKFQDSRNYKVLTDKIEKNFLYRPQVSVVQEIKDMKAMYDEKRIKSPFSGLYNNGEFVLGRGI